MKFHIIPHNSKSKIKFQMIFYRLVILIPFGSFHAEPKRLIFLTKDYSDVPLSCQNNQTFGHLSIVRSQDKVR
jgi:hypothetical protein